MTAGAVFVDWRKNNSKSCNVFDGVDDYVEIPHAAAQLGTNLGSGFTISAWINPRTRGEGTDQNSGRILDKSSGSVGTNGFMFFTDTFNGDNLFFRLNGGTGINSGASSIIFGTWQHVIVTISSAQICSFYINGIAKGTPGDLVQTISTITTTNAMRIGQATAVSNKTFDGGIKDVKMWNRVLSTTEITEEYTGTNHTDGLIHFFKLYGDYKDYGSVGATATNSGSIPVIVDDAIPTYLMESGPVTKISGAEFFVPFDSKLGKIGTVVVAGV